MTLKDKCEEALCVYKSTRFIRVRNKKLATIYYILLVCVLIYICVYTIWIDGGYQATDQVTGTTSVKLKGTGSTNGTVGKYTKHEKIYDAMDLVVPSIEEDAFFVTTSMIRTPNQKRDTCPGNKDVLPCNNTYNPCPNNTGLYDPMSQGIYTGNCCSDKVNPFQCSSIINSTSYPYPKADHCEVSAWCPTEDDSSSAIERIENIGAFTVFAKVDIAFSKFHFTQSNTIDKDDSGNPEYGYNLFTLNDIINAATKGKIKNVSADIQKNGAIILGESQWNCNLDQAKDKCGPVWKFTRIDSEPNTISFGFNYRAVDYNTGMSERLLRKLYGIRVVWTTTGIGKQFSFAQMTVTFGAGLAYLGAAAFLADIVMEKFLPDSDKYVAMKNKEDRVAGHGMSLRTVNDDNNNNDYREFSESTTEAGRNQ